MNGLRHRLGDWRNRSRRLLFLIGGLFCVGMGFLGAVVPGLPATVFFIMAAWCFARSSPRLERWVLELPGFGPMVADYRAGLGMPAKAKAAAITCIVVAVGLSAGFAIENLAVRLGVVALGAVGVWFIGWRVPTKDPALSRPSDAAEETPAVGR